MREMIKKILRSVYHIYRLVTIINWIPTLRLNFCKLSFGMACKLPILVYGKLKIYDLNGRIIIHGPVVTGLIKIGKNIDKHYSANLPGQWTISHDLIFNGYALISGGVTIETYKAPIEIGQCCVIGSGTMLKSESGIKIGDFTRVAYNCVVMDTNVHFIKNVKVGTFLRSTGPILIGCRCWLNPGVVVVKNAVLPDYTIVGRNSLANKDYSEFVGTHPFIAGVPAKPISFNLQRIFSNKQERELRKYFEENPEVDLFQSSEGEEQDPYKEVVPMFKYNY